MTQPTNVLIPAGAADVAKRAKATSQELWDRAAVLTVADDAEYEVGAVLLREVADRRRDLDATRKSITQPMDDAKRRVMDLFAPVLGQIEEAEKAVRKQMSVFVDQREAQARLAAAEAEARAKAEREEAEEAARILRSHGRDAEADEMIYEAAVAPVDIVATPQLPKVAGISTSGTWSAEVTDKMALVKHVASGLAPLDWLDVNMPRLNAMAKTMRESMNVPGARAVRKTGLTAR